MRAVIMIPLCCAALAVSGCGNDSQPDGEQQAQEGRSQRQQLQATQQSLQQQVEGLGPNATSEDRADQQP